MNKNSNFETISLHQNGKYHKLNVPIELKKEFSSFNYQLGFVIGEGLNQITFKNNVDNIAYSWVKTALEARAETIASADKYFYQLDSKSKKGFKELKDQNHPLILLKNSINRYNQDFQYTLFYLMTNQIDINGDSYLIVERDNKGIPFELRPTTSKIEVIFNINNIVTGYKIDGVTYKFEDIISGSRPNMRNFYKGVPITEGLSYLINVDVIQQIYSETFFKNYGRLLAVIQMKEGHESNKEQRDQLLESYKKMVTKNGEQVLVMPDYASYDEKGTSQKELDFVNTRINLRNEIMGRLRVPIIEVGATDNAPSRATADVVTLGFLKTMSNFSKSIENVFNVFIRREFGNQYFMKIDFPKYITEREIEFYRTMLQEKVLTAEQVANEVGYQYEIKQNNNGV